MADSVQLAFEALDKVTGPMQKMAQQANRLKETIARINSADKMSLQVMRSKTALMQEQIRAANRLQIAQVRASKAAMPKAPTGGGLGFFGALGAVGLGFGIAELVQGVLRLSAALVTMGVNAAVAFGKMAISSAVFSQNTRKALDMISKGHGAEEFDKIRKLAADLGMEVQSTVTQYKELRAMQFSAAQAEGIVKMAADMQALGADAQKVESVIRAITQVKAKGKLMMEELTSQLSEAGVSTELVLKNLAKTRGVSVDAVRKLISAGKIGAEEGVAAIQSAVMEKLNIKQLGEAGKAMADSTISGMRNRLLGKVENLWIDLGTKIEPALMKLKPIFDDLMSFMDSDEAKEILGGIVRGFEELGAAVLAAWPFVKEFVSSFKQGFGEGFSKTWETIKPLLDGLKKAFGGDESTQLKNIALFARMAGVAIGFFVAQGVSFALVVARIVQGVSLVTGKIRELITSITELAGKWDKITSLGKGDSPASFGLFGKGAPTLPTASSLTAASMSGTTPAPAVTNITNNNTPSISISVSGLTVEGLHNKIREIVMAQLKQQFGGAPN